MAESEAQAEVWQFSSFCLTWKRFYSLPKYKPHLWLTSIKKRSWHTIFKLLLHENHLRYWAETLDYFLLHPNVLSGKNKPNLRWAPWNFYVDWFIWHGITLLIIITIGCYLAQTNLKTAVKSQREHCKFSQGRVRHVLNRHGRHHSRWSTDRGCHVEDRRWPGYAEPSVCSAPPGSSRHSRHRRHPHCQPP